MRKLIPNMVDHLNLVLKNEGSCLQYIEQGKDCDCISYRLTVVDPYVVQKYQPALSVTDEFETKVRTFFKQYGVDSTGFTNTIQTIFAYDIEHVLD